MCINLTLKEKNCMDKFLHLCFKIGKWALSGVLVLLFITGVCIGGFVLTKTMSIDSYKIDYKADSFLSEQMGLASNKNDNKVATITKTKKDNKAMYAEAIKKALKDTKDLQLSDKQVNAMASYVDKNVNENDTKDFINNFPPYYNTLYNLLVKKGLEQYPNADEAKLRTYLTTKDGGVILDIFGEYTSQYERQVRLRDLENTKLKESRTIGIYAFLVILAVFIVVLIIPILIKIEENTRK